MSGIIGKKIGMTSVFSADGQNVACTVIEAGPCVITQVKNEETDGYRAVQLAYGERKPKNTPKALTGHFSKANTTARAMSSTCKNSRKGVPLPHKVTVALLFTLASWNLRIIAGKTWEVSKSKLSFGP